MTELVRKCGTMDVHKRLARTNLDYRNNRLNIEKRMLAFRRTPVTMKPIVIPVVVHVIYNTNEQNISKEQIRSQIQVLNKDFRKKNGDAKLIPTPFKKFAGDARIQFKLAVRDPDGKPTNGITRTQTNVESFSYDDAVKSESKGGIDAWPSDSYLNIWVCNLSDGLLGYAQFPGGPVDTDGVVINYRAFGNKGTATAPFDKGRTATHEIGHWLNLLHIWGDDGLGCDGSDNVEDTPNQAGANSGKPKFPHISCNNKPYGDMFMNYMDYTDDAAMFMFTKGQIERMHATLLGPRASILNSDALVKATKKTAAITLSTKSYGLRDSTKLVFNGVEWI